MRRRVVLRGIRFKMSNMSLLGVIFLAFCFLCGGFIGYLCVSLSDHSSREALNAYLRDYCSLVEVERMPIPIKRCLPIYFGYGLIAFLSSFSLLGIICIPAAAFAFGFNTMYAVSCFAFAFGRNGVVLALSSTIVRLLFTLPCFFLISDKAWPISGRLALLSFGKRCDPKVYRGSYFTLFLACVLFMTVGVFCECLVTPHLFRLAVMKLI